MLFPSAKYTWPRQGLGQRFLWYNYNMSIRKVPFVLDEYYHLYNRGNDKREIFHDHSDYIRFLGLLYLANSDINFRVNRIKDIYSTERGKRLVSIGTYCLMPNHFHILIKQAGEGNVSRFMQKLLTAYSMYYNTKYERTGGLFEGKFKSEHLDNDRYLKYVFSYIHLNPVKLIEPKWKESGIKDKAGALAFLGQYAYSSYQDFLKGGRREEAVLDRADFPDYFPSKKEFRKEILDWINFK